MSHSILMVCRIEKDKGIQYMVKAMPEVLKSIPDATLTIVGEGSYKPVIQKLVDKLGLNSNVILIGTVPLEQLPEVYNSHTVFVNSTIRQNGYDLTILEAMSCGMPVVCTNIGSIPTVVRSLENGWLVQMKNRDDISKGASLPHAIISLLKDKEGRDTLSMFARATILNNFTNDKMVDETIKVYQEVIKNYHKHRKL